MNKELIIFSLLSVLLVSFGCESYENEDIQEQEEQRRTAEPVQQLAPERAGRN